MRCEELMTPDPEVLHARGTVRDAAAQMRDANVGFLPIIDDAEQVVGVLTDRDLVVRVMAQGLSLETRAEEVMTAEVISCRPDDDLEQVEDLMSANRKTRLAVIDEGGRLAGVISIADIAQYEDASRAGDVVGDITEREMHP